MSVSVFHRKECNRNLKAAYFVGPGTVSPLRRPQQEQQEDGEDNKAIFWAAPLTHLPQSKVGKRVAITRKKSRSYGSIAMRSWFGIRRSPLQHPYEPPPKAGAHTSDPFEKSMGPSMDELLGQDKKGTPSPSNKSGGWRSYEQNAANVYSKPKGWARGRVLTWWLPASVWIEPGFRDPEGLRTSILQLL